LGAFLTTFVAFNLIFSADFFLVSDLVFDFATFLTEFDDFDSLFCLVIVDFGLSIVNRIN